MKTRTKFLLSLAAASVVLAGCEMMREHEHREHGYGDNERGYVKPLGGVRSDCGNTVCFVTIDVNNCNIAEPGELHVHAKQTQIIFRLTAGDHDFTRDGIDFKGASPFSGGMNQGKGVYVVHDTNDFAPPGPPKRYKYKITVKKDGAPGNCTPRDPDVVNDTPW